MSYPHLKKWSNKTRKNAYVAWNQARMEFPSVRSQLAVVETQSELAPQYSRISSVQTARRQDEGDDAWKGTLKQDYNKAFNQTKIALQVDVTEKLRLFDKYDEIMRRMRLMGDGVERRMELDIASLLYSAWSSTYTNLDGETVTTTTPDGLTLISAAHTCNGSSSTFSNQIATTHSAFDQNVLEKLEEVFNGMLDSADGRNVPVMPDTIITGRHAPTVHAVRRVLGSEFYTENANNSVNTYKGQYKHLIVPLLDVNPQTEARNSSMNRYCFLAALGNKDKNGFRMVSAKAPYFQAPEQVFDSGTWQFQAGAWYDFGTLFANFIVGTKGDGTAV